MGVKMLKIIKEGNLIKFALVHERPDIRCVWYCSHMYSNYNSPPLVSAQSRSPLLTCFQRIRSGVRPSATVGNTVFSDGEDLLASHHPTQ
jgi:hypothetical protein